MKKFAAVAMTAMMCVLLAAGCGKSDDKEEATEAAEPVTEIAITADTVDMPTEPPVEAEVEEYDFAVQEETVSENAEPVVEEPEVDEFGVAAIDEIKLYAKETVKMRSEPNTDSDVKGMLKAGDEVTANGKSEEWHRIAGSNGETVYVKSEYLTETKPEKSEETKAEENSNKQTNDSNTETTATDTSNDDAAKQVLALQALAQQNASNQNANQESANNTTQNAATTETAATTVVPAAAAVGVPSWVVGAHGVDSAGAVKAYNHLKNVKGLDDATIQGNWDSLMFHYSEHGTAGW